MYFPNALVTPKTKQRSRFAITPTAGKDALAFLLNGERFHKAA